MPDCVVGAYGLRLAGCGSREWLAVEGGEEWPEVVVAVDGALRETEMVTDMAAGRLRIRPDVIHSELVHPLLGRAGSRFALSRGDDAMHAGAILGASGAWAVIGAKGMGKSSLLAALAAAGVPVLTDDVTVFAGDRVLAGPRCIDLRRDADRFGPAVDVRPALGRRRISLPPVRASAPLTGLLHLDWGGHLPRLERLGLAPAMSRLTALHAEKGFPRNPSKVLDLLALPAYRLCRPRAWSHLGRTVEVVGTLLETGPDEAPAAPSGRVATR